MPFALKTSLILRLESRSIAKTWLPVTYKKMAYKNH